MAIINQATKELQVKIVYYGPAKSGKTTNLEQVHANVKVPNPDAKGKMAGRGMEAALSRVDLPRGVVRIAIPGRGVRRERSSFNAPR